MGTRATFQEKALHVPAQCRDAPTHWGWSRLDDVCAGIFDCQHSTPPLTPFGPYVVRSQDIITRIFRTDRAARVSEETYQERTARAIPERGDLLYSREGTYFGIAAEVPQDTRVCLGQRMVLIRPEPTTVDFRYLRYWLNSPIMAAHIHGFRDGSVAERLNMPTIRALPVLMPPLEEQRRIAHILGTLDDKIELNRRMNETLEAIARAIFKSWFVDFDPVRAKAEGRQPAGMDPETAALFPSEFVDSELGPIPKGWEVQEVGSLCSLAYGKALKASDRKEGQVPVYGSNGPVGTHSRALVKGPGVVIGRKGNPGVVTWSHTDFFPIDTAFYLEPLYSFTDLHYLYFQLQEMNLPTFGADSAVPGLNRNTAESLPTVAPPLALRETFARLVIPLFLRMKANDRESDKLNALRDLMLPKLLSGSLELGENIA